MKNKIFSVLMLLFLMINLSDVTYSQNVLSKDYFKNYNFLKDGKNKLTKDDSSKIISGKNSVKKVNSGGIFLAPYIGYAIPTGLFGDQSNTGFLWGVKVELAYSKLYPLIFGFIYENQSIPGNPEFTTTNSLTSFETDMNNIGGSVDLLLNKYIKSNFTSLILSVEVKYSKVVRTITSNIAQLEELPGDENLLIWTAGLGFTIYVFDLGGRYTYAEKFSNISFLMRIHIPVVKF